MFWKGRRRSSKLSASTIEELFKDNGYNLDTVKTKLVNAGNQLTKLLKNLKILKAKKKKKLSLKLYYH